MPSQVLSEQSSAVGAFAALLRVHSATTRLLSAQLQADHGLTINDYEVLLRLFRSPDRRMRRVDLAGEVLLTASGVTRLLDGLERSGYVERGTCETDRRVVYAVLTEAGAEKLRSASQSHLAQIEDLLSAHLDSSELDTLAGLLTRIAEDDPGCAPG
jgi:DNA-binding MarR family transcriptional regulator